MKTVTVITGNTGVGKSTIAELLMRSTPESGWYDCDIPWKTNPGFSIHSGRLKERMIGVATMCAAAADAYFAAGLHHVFLSGVLPGDVHFENIRKYMSTQDVDFSAFWLTCEADVNRQRLIERDGNDQAFVDLSEYLRDSTAVPVDCTSSSATEVARTIAELTIGNACNTSAVNLEGRS
jgi:hypothetical protein